MTEIISDLSNFLIIGLGGFIAVEAFRYFRDEKKAEMGNFRLFGLSIFWGLVILLFNDLLLRNDPGAIEDLIGNPLAAGLVLSCIGGVGGWAFSLIAKSKWFKAMVSFLRNPWSKLKK